MPATAVPTPPSPLAGAPLLPSVGGANATAALAPAGVGLGANTRNAAPAAARNSGRDRKPSTRLQDLRWKAGLGRAPTAAGVPAGAWEALAAVFARPVQQPGPGFRGPGGVLPPGPSSSRVVKPRPAPRKTKKKQIPAPPPGPAPAPHQPVTPTLQPVRRSVLDGLAALDSILAGGGGEEEEGGGGPARLPSPSPPSPDSPPPPGVQ